jgi:hypothetical protein
MDDKHSQYTISDFDLILSYYLLNQLTTSWDPVAVLHSVERVKNERGLGEVANQISWKSLGQFGGQRKSFVQLYHDGLELL